MASGTEDPPCPVAGYDSRAVLSYARRQGILQTETTHAKRLVRFGPRSVRCVVIKPEESENVTDVTTVTSKKNTVKKMHIYNKKVVTLVTLVTNVAI